ncbi:unnamed protein product [Ilex paraguariensis]|uniref:Uncharacterized protein n=1 Tax=Ilex paraguariensis TaxID=185542 RepID=A0ABC8UR07_9AQUA
MGCYSRLCNNVNPPNSYDLHREHCLRSLSSLCYKKKVIMMKIDFSGLQSTATSCGPNNELFDGISTAPSFQIPGTTDFDGFQKEAIQMVKPAKGTTTLAFIFKDGVMVAADSRASMGGYIFEEAAELARRAIYHATFRDGASGGVASVYHVGPDGWKKLSGDDVGELHYMYYPVEPTAVEQEMIEVSGA